MTPAQLNRELFQRLFDAAPDPILIFDQKGSVILVNAEAERQFGYPSAEFVGQDLNSIVPERFRQAHQKHVQAYNASPSVRPMGSGRELYALRRDGSEFPVEISLSPMESSDGRYVIAIVRDITLQKGTEKELKQAMRELARSNKELEEFAYIASHDLQEPLRSVAGSCQLLQRRYADKLDDEAHEFIGFAVAGAKRMEELINDLLTYSRVSTKATEPTLCDFNMVLLEVLENLRSSITESGAEITHDVMPEIPADHWQIGQLFQNLTANSLKFHGSKPPRIHIGARNEGSAWHFSVEDNGIGIDPKYFDRIFVVFKRLHNREEYPGTGIGLASCKKIVERHDGKIWLESTVGKGTTFHFTIPYK